MTEEIIPTIQGKACTIDPDYKEDGLFAKLGLSKWKCPFCKANITTKNVCLNGCGLTAPEYRKLITLTA